MAISAADVKIIDNVRQELKAKNMDQVSFTLGGAGVSYAGIKPGFEDTLVSAIGTYADNAKEALSKLESVDSSSAFQGTGVSAALAEFVTGVREVGDSFIMGLRNAENQIIRTVHDAYANQDNQLKGQVDGATGDIQAQRMSTDDGSH